MLQFFLFSLRRFRKRGESLRFDERRDEFWRSPFMERPIRPKALPNVQHPIVGRRWRHW